MKKKFTHGISVLLTVLIIALSLPVTAFAEQIPTEYENLSLGQVYYLDHMGAKYFRYIPEESGIYLLETYGYNDTFVSVYDGNMNYLTSKDDGGEEGNFSLSLEMKANSIYYLKMGSYTYYGEYTFNILKPEVAEEIAVYDTDKNAIESIFAHTGRTMRVFAGFLPAGTVSENVTWSMENENIASVDQYGNITFITSGSTKLIATSGNLVKEIPVVVEYTSEISVERGIIKPFSSEGDHLCYTFTPAEDGNYRFVYSEYEGVEVKIYDSYGAHMYTDVSNLGDGKAKRKSSPLEMFAGKEYVVKVKYTADNKGDFEIIAEKVIIADSVLLYINKLGDKIYNYNTFYTYVGETFSLGYTTFPENSVGATPFYYVGDNDEVATVSPEGYFNALKEGYVYVTVRNDNGISDTMLVCVQEKEKQSLDIEYAPNLDSSRLGLHLAEIEVPKSQWYTFNFSAVYDTKFYVTCRETGETVSHVATNGVLNIYAEQGYNLDIRVESLNPNEYNACWYTIRGIIFAETVRFVDENGNEISEYYCDDGNEFRLSYEVIPEGADTSEFYWRTDNPDVLNVYWDGSIYPHSTGIATVYYGTETVYGSITVYSKRIIDIQSNMGYDLNINSDSRISDAYRFKPQESGYYSLYMTGQDSNCYSIVTNVTDNKNVELIPNSYVSDSTSRDSYYFEAGKEYLIEFNMYANYGSFIYTVSLIKHTTPTSVSIFNWNTGYNVEDTTLYPDEQIEIEYRYGYAEGDVLDIPVKWVLSDPTVATIEPVGDGRYNLRPLKAGSTTVTLETGYEGVTASFELTVIVGNEIFLDKPVTQEFSYDTVIGTRYVFTPEKSGYYRFFAKRNSSNAFIALNFTVTDSNYNEIHYYSGSNESFTCLMTAGSTYIIKVNDNTNGGSYEFNLVSADLILDTTANVTIPATAFGAIYTFTPEEDGLYRITTVNNPNKMLAVEVYTMSGELISDFSYENGEYCSKVTLLAGNVYQVHLNQNGYDDEVICGLKVTKEVGIKALEVIQRPSREVTYLDDVEHYFSGLILNVIISDKESFEWIYNDSPDYIRDFKLNISYKQTAEDTVTYYFAAGGAVAEINYTILTPQAIMLDTPVECTYSLGYDKLIYTFTAEKDGYYKFESYDYTLESDDRFMDINGTSSTKNELSLVNFTELVAGQTYNIHLYKYYEYEDSFKLVVSEAAEIESMTVKQYPYNSTVFDDDIQNADFSGLVLEVETSDGLVREWEYIPYDNSIFGYTYDHFFTDIEDGIVRHYISVGDVSVEISFIAVAYPLESIEVITACDITFIQNQDGEQFGDKFIYNYPSWDLFRIKLNYNDGTFKFAYMNECVDGYYINYGTNTQYEDPWTECGEYAYTIEYRGCTASIPVFVKEQTTSAVRELESFKLYDGSLSVMEGHGYYTKNEAGEYVWLYNFDTSHLRFEVKFKGEEPIIIGRNDEIGDYHIEITSNQFENPILSGQENFVSFCFMGQEELVPVTVTESNVKNITLTKQPEGPYIYGDSSMDWSYTDENGNEIYKPVLNMWDGFEFEIEYKDGTKEIVNSDKLDDNGYYKGADITITLEEQCKIGKNKAILAYGGIVCPFELEVIETPITSIEVTGYPTAPESAELYHDMSKLEFTVTYSDGSTEEISLADKEIWYGTDSELSCYADLGGKTVEIIGLGEGLYEIRYKGFSSQFNIADYVKCQVAKFRVLEWNEAEQTVTVAYIMIIGNEYVQKIRVIDLSLADESWSYEGGGHYSSVVYEDGGVFGYDFGYYKNEQGTIYDIYMLGQWDGGMKEIKMSDLNGDGVEDIRDLIRLKKLLAGEDVAISTSADFNADGAVESRDLVCLRKDMLGQLILTSVKGDVDGDGIVTRNDAMTLALYIAGSPEQLSSVADVNDDGIIDALDKKMVNDIYEASIA